MAATAALAAKEQNKFWEYHQKLFDSFNTLDDSKITAFAVNLGLDMDKFNSDLHSPSIQGIINRDIQEGFIAEVSGIPAVFVNGRILHDPTFQGFQQAIDFELNKRSASQFDPAK